MRLSVGEAVRLWLDSIEVDGRHTARTVREYRYKAASLIGAWPKGMTVDLIDKNFLREWMAVRARAVSERGRPLTMKTRKNEICFVSAFCRWLVQEDMIAANPVEKLTRPKIKGGSPIFLDAPEIERLFGAINQGTWTGLRDYTIFVVFANTGMRLSELLGLKLGDLELDATTRVIRVLGKGEAPRVARINSVCFSALTKWLAVRGKATSDHLFIAKKHGHGLSKAFIEKIMHEYGEKAEIAPHKCTPHKLRHSYATYQLANKSNLREVQEALGHVSVMSTQIYTHVLNEHLTEMAERVSFGGNQMGTKIIAEGA